MIAGIKQFFQRSLRSPEIKRKIIITALILIVFRFMAHVPAAGIDRESLKSLFGGNAFLSLLDIFSGGTLANFSILSLGLGPYINASIILQLFTYVFPALKELSREGEYGQEKINQYTKLLTIPLAIIQSFLMYSLLHRVGIISLVDPLSIVALVATMTAGTMLAVWLGDLITQYGITNGVSFLIFVGIISRLPVTIGNSLSTAVGTDTFKLVIFAAVALILLGLVTLINEAARHIPISSARKSRSSINSGGASYLPLKVNQAGVIPIFFAVSLTVMPTFLGQFLSSVDSPQARQIGDFLVKTFSTQSIFYNLIYFVMVFGFTYFYTSVTFNPKDVSENLQKAGSFIPGVRPGHETEKYLSFVLSRITFAGALFLGSIAVLPSLLQGVIGVSNLLIGGTGILIVVSVVLEVVRQLEAHQVMRRYEGFLER